MSRAHFKPEHLLDVSFEPFGDAFLIYPRLGSGGVVVTPVEREAYLNASPLKGMSLHRKFSRRPSANVKRTRWHVRKRLNLAEPVAHAYFRLIFAGVLCIAAIEAHLVLALFKVAAALYLAGRALEILWTRWKERRNAAI